MQFFNQYGVGMGQPMAPKTFYQPMQMLNAPSGRVIQPSGGFGGGGSVSPEGVAAMIAGSPSPMPPGMGSGAGVSGGAPGSPPGWSTPPFNPAGSVNPMGATPPPVTGTPEPAGVPNVAVTVDQEGNIETGDPLVDAATTSSQQPLTYYLDEEEPSRAQRMQAGFLMMSAAGTPQFGQTAALATAALAKSTQQARDRNEQLRAMTRDREWVEGATKDGYYKVKQPAIAKMSEDGKSVTLLENAPGQSREWISNSKSEERAIRNDRNGVPRYEDTGEPVFPNVEADPSGGQTFEKIAVPQRMVELQDIIENPASTEDEKQNASQELAAIESMLPRSEVESARELLLVNSVKNSETRLSNFAEGMDGVVYAKRVTEDMLERIENNEIDTGILSGILTNMGLGDQGQGELKAKQIFQLLQNLQITKLTPVSNFEIDLVSKAWADVANGKAQNLGALKAALETMNAKMEQGFAAYGRDLQNVRSANVNGIYDNILGNYEGYLGDYDYEVIYDESGRATVRKKGVIPVDGLTFDDLWPENGQK